MIVRIARPTVNACDKSITNQVVLEVMQESEDFIVLYLSYILAMVENFLYARTNKRLPIGF